MKNKYMNCSTLSQSHSVHLWNRNKLSTNVWKMKPLVTNQWILTWFYVFPAGIAVKWSNILLSTTIFLIISLLSLICIALNVDYFLKFLKIDLEESLFALYQIAVGLMMANAIIVIFLSRHKLVNIFKSLDEIYKISMNFFYRRTT